MLKSINFLEINIFLENNNDLIGNAIFIKVDE